MKGVLAYNWYSTGSSKGYEKTWAPYRNPRATANRFEEVDLEVDRDYQRQPSHRDFAYGDYHGYPPHSIRNPRRSSFHLPTSSPHSVDAPRASHVPRRGQSLSDKCSSRPAHIHFEPNRRPEMPPQAYTAQGRPQSSTFPPFNHTRSFCPLQGGFWGSIRSLSANRMATGTNPSWDPRSRDSSMDPGNFDGYRPSSSVEAQLGPRTEQRDPYPKKYGRNNSFPSIDLHSRSRGNSSYGPISGRSSHRGPVSDAAHSAFIGDLESDPEGSRRPQRFDRHSPYEHSESPRGSSVSVASLSQGDMQHDSHSQPPDFQSFDERVPGNAIFEGPNGHRMDPRAANAGGSGYERESEGPDRFDEGREDVH